MLFIVHSFFCDVFLCIKKSVSSVEPCVLHIGRIFSVKVCCILCRLSSTSSAMKQTAITFILSAGSILGHDGNDRTSDFSLAFRKSFSLENSYNLPNALEHEFGSMDSKSQSMFSLACAPYDGEDDLLSFIGNHQHQPVFSSQSDDRVCYSVYSDYALPQVGGINGLTLTPIPHILKIDDSVERIGAAEVLGTNGHRVLELSMGLGVGGKGIQADVEETVQDIMDHAESLSRDDTELMAHFKEFYWTSESPVAAQLPTHKRKLLDVKRSLYTSVSPSHVTCDLSAVEVHKSRSHMLLTFPHDEVQHLSPCFMLVASVAALSPHVSHVSAYEGYESSVNSIPYDSDTCHATDQNAWLQSGNSKDKPYSDAGLDGTDYVLSVVDSGGQAHQCI